VLPKKEIGARLRALRLEQGISQVELAKLIGTHQTAVSQVEVGRRGVSLRQIVRLCRALKVTPDRILGENLEGPRVKRLRDGKVMRRLEKIETLPPAKQRALLQMVDAFIEKHGRPESSRPDS
jgi:transcriptional regulator with XRE-family HTH domain